MAADMNGWGLVGKPLVFTKPVLAGGAVTVNSEPETRRGRQL